MPELTSVEMKPPFRISHRYESIMSAARTRRRGGRKLPFHALSRDYFAREAHHHFAIEATVFCLLLLTTVLPLLNSAKAVLDLVQSGEGLTGL